MSMPEFATSRHPLSVVKRYIIWLAAPRGREGGRKQPAHPAVSRRGWRWAWGAHGGRGAVQIFVENEGKVAKLSLIDLAGSERALATDQRTKRSAEGAHINKSLLALCECINALVQGKKHVPYRNSKLTQLLKDSLSGGCKTVRAPAPSPRHHHLGWRLGVGPLD